MAITREEVAQAMHGWVEAFNARDVARVWAMEGGGVGYGYRTRAPRAVTISDDAEFKRWSARFFETFESRRMELEILETDVAGAVAAGIDVALLAGVSRWEGGTAFVPTSLLDAIAP